MKCPKCNENFAVDPYRSIDLSVDQEEMVTDNEIKYLQKLTKQLNYLEKKNEFLKSKSNDSSSHYRDPSYSSLIITLGIIICIMPVIIAVIAISKENSHYKSWCYIATYNHLKINEKNTFLLYRYNNNHANDFIGAYNSIQEAKVAAENLSCNLK